MRYWKKLELEWKILILASVLFVAFAWPVEKLFVSGLEKTLEQSIDPELGPLLRKELTVAEEEQRQAIISSIERNLQWKAVIPIIMQEQSHIAIGFSIVMFLVFFLLALWTLRSLTRPLKNLAFAVSQIGKGKRAEIKMISGGALGILEASVAALQDELDVLREQARVQGEQRAWQDIARVMAHEIKNPLTPIRLTLDRIEEKTLLGDAIDNETLKTFLSRMNTQVDVLERLVNQFRSFSREPEAQLTPLEIGKVLASAADDLTGSLESTVTGSATVIADPYLMKQVFLNIWKNALEAGASNIKADISIRDLKTQIHISDNGPGIKVEDIERVWLPYVTFKKGGTGLGLPVVKKLIETMGGSVSLSSITKGPNHGLTIAITLPLDIQGDTHVVG